MSRCQTSVRKVKRYRDTILLAVTEEYNALLILFHDISRHYVGSRSEAFIVGFLRTHRHQHEHINTDYKSCVQSLCDSEPDDEA